MNMNIDPIFENPCFNWAVHLSPEEYAKYKPMFGEPIGPVDALIEKHFTCAPSDNITLTMLLLIDDDQPLSACAKFSLHDDKDDVTLTVSKEDGAIDDRLSIEYHGVLYSAWFTKPESATIYVHQRPVNVSFECPGCQHDVDVAYDDFCAEHGDPPDWQFDTITCPNCGQKITIENQDWDC